MVVKQLHTQVQTMSRSHGKSAVASAAYRAGDKLVDERTGELHDYSRKGGVWHTEMVMPHGLEMTREQLWNKVEAAEKRRNSTVAREIEISLPHEMNDSQRLDLARDIARKLVAKHGVAVDLGFHRPGKGGDQRNEHVHALMTTRRLDAQGNITEKSREWDDRKTGSALVTEWRETIAQTINEHCERAGLDVFIEHRSYEEQALVAGSDIVQIPTRHLGPAASAMERRGVLTDIGNENREIHRINKEMEELQAEAHQLDAEIIDLEAERQRRAALVPGIQTVAEQDRKDRFKSQIFQKAYGETAARQMGGHFQWVDPEPHNGTRRIDLKGGTRIVDAGDSLTAVKAGKSVQFDAKALAILAKAKGFKDVQITGSDQFKAEAWLQLSKRGVAVLGYEPSAELQQRLDAEMKPKAQPKPELVADDLPDMFTGATPERAPAPKPVLAKPKPQPVDDLPDMFLASEPEPVPAPVRRTRKDELREAFERGEHIELRGSDKDMIDELWKAAEEGSELKQRFEDASNELYYNSGDSYDDIFPFI